jgi:RNA recognition motif-containing protein
VLKKKDHVILGRSVEVKKMLKKDQISSAVKNERKRKMFAGNLQSCSTNQSLRKYFSKFGKVSNAYIIKKPGSCQSRGFGYVTFESEETMKKVLSMKHKLDGGSIVVESFLSKED